MSERRLLAKPEAAKLLAMSESTLEKLTAGKKIPHVKLGRSVRYDSADLWGWIEAKKIGPAIARQPQTEVNSEPQKGR